MAVYLLQIMVLVMEINSSNVAQVQQSQQPQQQQAVEQRAFEEDLAAQQLARQSVEATIAPEQSTTSDYTNLVRDARAQQVTIQTPAAATSEGSQPPDAQQVAVTVYQNNQESYEAPTSSGQLLPRVDAIV
jgi:hypothetical protein